MTLPMTPEEHAAVDAQLAIEQANLAKLSTIGTQVEALQVSKEEIETRLAELEKP